MDVSAHTGLIRTPAHVAVITKYTVIGGMRISNQFSDWLSTFFDVGGLFGTILCGAVSDIIDTRAVIIAVFLYTSVPLVSL